MPPTSHRKPDATADKHQYKWLILQRITFRGGEHSLDGMGNGVIVVDNKELVRDLCVSQSKITNSLNKTRHDDLCTLSSVFKIPLNVYEYMCNQYVEYF